MSVGVGAMLPTTCIQPAVAAGLWEPEASDVLEADGQLASFLAEQVQGPIPYVLEDFYRQYFGIVVDGRRELYVNGFAARLRRMLREYGEPRVDWRKAPLDICDGGPAHWRAQYDLERGEWTNFETGGFG